MNLAEPMIPVLVVDDEQDIRDGCERILSRIGCSVTQAADGAQGLKLVARQPFKVVLLDLKMPGIGGMEVLDTLRKEHPDLLVIIITGYATVETAIEAMKLGAYDFIPKPFKPDELKLTVRRALEKIRLQEQTRRLQEERRRTLADLHTEQSRTRTIIKAIPFGVMVTSRDGRVALMNPALRRMLGLAADSQPGGGLAEYVEDPGFCQMALSLSQGEGEPPEGNDWSHEFSTPAGSDLLCLGTRISDEKGDCLGGVLVMMDMTPYRLLDQLKSEFVAKVSHELRSPLSTILLQLQVLTSSDESLDEGGRKLLHRAQERTRSLITLVKELLDLSRIEQGHAMGEPESVRPDEFLPKVVEAMGPQASQKGQSLALELPQEPLPALNADPGALESVFTNLLTNAVLYTPEQGSIVMRASRARGFLRVDVQDNGVGIPEDKIGKVFDKFFRVKNPRTAGVVGTGLGLPIVKSLVEAMGGRVEVQSKEGHGSTFSVYLPAG